MFDKVSESLRKTLKLDARYVLKGTVWIGIYQLLVASSNFLASLAFANWIAPEAYGEYKYIFSVASFLNAFAPLGFGTAIVRYTSEGYTHVLKAGFRKIFVWSFGFFILTVATGAYYIFRGNSGLGLPLLLVACTYPIINSATAYASHLIGQQRFKESSLYAGAVSFAFSMVMIVGLLFTKSVLALAVINVFSNLALNLFVYARTKDTDGKGKRLDDKEFVSYGLHQSAINFLNIAAAQIDKILVFQFAGAALLAVYVFAVAIPEQVKSLFKNTSTFILPRFAQRSLAEIRRGMPKYFLLFFIATAAVSAAYALVAPFLFGLFFKKYLDAVFLSQIYSIGLFTVAAILPQTALQAKGLHKELYISSLTSNIIQIVLDVICISFWGLWGMAAAQLVGRFANLVILTALLYFAKNSGAGPKKIEFSPEAGQT